MDTLQRTRLVLTRQPGEKIMIDGGIEIEVVHVKGKNVRLAFVAPKGVRVDREEVALKRLA